MPRDSSRRRGHLLHVIDHADDLAGRGATREVESRAESLSDRRRPGEVTSRELPIHDYHAGRTLGRGCRTSARREAGCSWRQVVAAHDCVFSDRRPPTAGRGRPSMLKLPDSNAPESGRSSPRRHGCPEAPESSRELVEEPIPSRSIAHGIETSANRQHDVPRQHAGCVEAG
jgi:hypothetical protein